MGYDMWIIWMEYERDIENQHHAVFEHGLFAYSQSFNIEKWCYCIMYGLYKYPWSILDSDRAWCNVLGGSPGLLNRLGSGWSYNYSRSQNILGSWCAGSYWRLFMSQSMVDSWKKYRVDQIWHPIWSHEFLPANLWVLSLRLVERFPRKLQQIVQYFAQETVLMAMNALASKSHLKRWCFQRDVYILLKSKLGNLKRAQQLLLFIEKVCESATFTSNMRLPPDLQSLPRLSPIWKICIGNDCGIPKFWYVMLP
jgi:hypothetical protein